MLAPVPCFTCFPVNGLFILFLSFDPCESVFVEDEVEVMEAAEELGEETLLKMDEVEERCKSIGDGLSSWSE